MPQILGDLKLNIILDVIKADENANKFVGALKSVEVQSDKTEAATVSLKSKFQNLGLTINGISAGFSILKATLGDFVASFQQQEVATQKLINGLKNVGEGAKALEKLNKQASELQKITVYDDAEINNAQAMLTTFMKSSDEIEILTPRLLDLSAAFDQSGEGGKSLQEVAVMLGKVNEETIGALRRVGVAFSKEQEEKLKSLRGTEQAIYLSKILDQNFKGLAETIGNTSAGKLRIFKNQVGELKEKFGELITKALTPLLQPLSKFIDYLNNAPPRVQTAALAISGLVVAFTALNGSIPGSLKLLSFISAIIIALPDKLRNLAIAIGIVATAWWNQERILNALNKALGNMGDAAEKGFGKMANASSRASLIMLGKLALVAAAIYTLLELIDGINEESERAKKEANQIIDDAGTKRKDIGKSDNLGGQDASLQKYFKERASSDEGIKKSADWKKIQKDPLQKIKEYEQKIKENLGLDDENIDKKTKGTGTEKIKEELTYLQSLSDELDKINSRINAQSTAESEAEGLFIKRKDLEIAIDYVNNLEKYKQVSSQIGTIGHDITSEGLTGLAEKVKSGVRGVPLDDTSLPQDKERGKSKVEEGLTASLSLAQQLTGILGIGADTFAGKLIGGLQEGLSLANSFANLLSLVLGIGSGGIFGLLGLASGGQVPGSGEGDTVPAMLTPGEFVVRKSVVSKIGSGFFEWINGGGLLNSLAGHYAQGGMVAVAGAGGVQVVVLDSIIKGSDIVLSQRRSEVTEGRRKA